MHEDEELMGTDLAEIGEYAYFEEEAKNPEESPYVIEPIRSTDARVSKLKAAAAAGEQAPKVVDGTTADGQGFVSPDDGTTASDQSRK